MRYFVQLNGLHNNAAVGQLLCRLVVAAFVQRLLQQVSKARFDLGKVDAILRTLWPGHARHHRRKVEFEQLAVLNLVVLGHAEQALRLIIGAECVDMFFGSSLCQQVAARLLVYREKAHRRAILRCHIADGRAVG